MEQQQQEQQVLRVSPYNNPMSNYGGSILLLTNPDNELYKMELTLRNMYMDKDNNPQSAGVPLLNNEGITSVLGQVQAIVNQVTIMSNLDKTEVTILVDFLGDSLAKDLMLNREKYEIKNPAARDKIYFASLTTSYICLKRAFEEGDKRFWKGSQQEITTRNEAPPRAGGFWSGMGLGGK